MLKPTNKSNSLGQYYTKHPFLQRSVLQLIRNRPECILEPSIGRGDLVNYLKKHLEGVVFDIYEIDETIQLLDGIEGVIYGNFLEKQIDKKYKTIIGNPPYVKSRKGNLYLEFIDKCFGLLEEGGELIFIVPSDFIKITGSSPLIRRMMSVGHFTDFVFPDNEHLFDNASVDVMVFRYCLGDMNRRVKVSRGMECILREESYLIETEGILTFSNNLEVERVRLSDYFEIGVGMVSGKESVFKHNQLGNIEVLNAQNRRDRYILIEDYPSGNESINHYLQSHKPTLLRRKIRTFHEGNWYEWGALRNQDLVNRHWGKSCLYMSTVTRKDEVCFQDRVSRFGGGLIIMIPKIPLDLPVIIDYLNSDRFKKDYIYSGRFKIGHKQLSNGLIDRKLID